ncbi:MAG TPA: hypothetical protein VMJ65_13960 [Solirubrobacteraceae bacterium]|nr:hypothetical protein [Solirubrobacteraceae bacterium]
MAWQGGERRVHVGTKLDEEWAAFIREHDFLVGLSTDGPREPRHLPCDERRARLRSGDARPRHLREGAVAYNLLTTVHAADERRGREVYRFLRDECGARLK